MHLLFDNKAHRCERRLKLQCGMQCERALTYRECFAERQTRVEDVGLHYVADLTPELSTDWPVVECNAARRGRDSTCQCVQQRRLTRSYNTKQQQQHTVKNNNSQQLLLCVVYTVVVLLAQQVVTV